MPRLLMITVYDAEEACAELAKKVGRTEPYGTKSLYYFIKQYSPNLPKAGRHYFLTDGDLEFLASSIKKPGRPKKTLDK